MTNPNKGSDDWWIIFMICYTIAFMILFFTNVFSK